MTRRTDRKRRMPFWKATATRLAVFSAISLSLDELRKFSTLRAVHSMLRAVALVECPSAVCANTSASLGGRPDTSRFSI